MNKLFVCFFCILLLLPLCSCSQEFSLDGFVSERRTDILIGKTDSLSLRINVTMRESPYLCDGVCGEMHALAECLLTAEDLSASYTLCFFINGEDYSAELNFSSVEQVFSVSLPVDLSAVDTLPCKILCDNVPFELTCKSVKTQATLSCREILNAVAVCPEAGTDALRDKNGFLAEVYIRLIYDGGCFYYVGITDKNGNTRSLLFDGETARLIAFRN